MEGRGPEGPDTTAGPVSTMSETDAAYTASKNSNAQSTGQQMFVNVQVAEGEPRRGYRRCVPKNRRKRRVSPPHPSAPVARSSIRLLTRATGVPHGRRPLRRRHRLGRLRLRDPRLALLARRPALARH